MIAGSLIGLPDFHLKQLREHCQSAVPPDGPKNGLARKCRHLKSWVMGASPRVHMSGHHVVPRHFPQYGGRMHPKFDRDTMAEAECACQLRLTVAGRAAREAVRGEAQRLHIFCNFAMALSRPTARTLSRRSTVLSTFSTLAAPELRDTSANCERPSVVSSSPSRCAQWVSERRPAILANRVRSSWRSALATRLAKASFLGRIIR